jgi:hypothetical protein
LGSACCIWSLEFYIIFFSLDIIDSSFSLNHS